jgi:hypothetical protein
LKKDSEIQFISAPPSRRVIGFVCLLSGTFDRKNKKSTSLSLTALRKFEVKRSTVEFSVVEFE